MKNLKVVWPTVIAIALAVGITSCHNNQLVENYEKRQFSESLPKFEDTFEPSKYRIEEIKRLDLEESSYQEEQTDTTSFSK